MIDIGAHAGQFTKLFSKKAKHVIAIEPSSYALSLLKKVIRLRRLKNVTLFNCGVGDKVSEIQLNVPVKKSGSLGFGLSFIGSTTTQSDRTALSATGHLHQQQSCTVQLFWLTLCSSRHSWTVLGVKI